MSMLSVGRISEGFVLDHIQAGKSMDIYRYLRLGELDCTVAIIKNAKSNKMGRKDIIKIDRCFIIDIGKDEFSESFVKMVAELAATIGVIVCVEGVETKEQYEALSKMRIQQIQGFYYDRPMQAELFEEKYV